ncbi:MAG: ATP-binding protein, partial [Patescibacteria group bacterium]
PCGYFGDPTHECKCMPGQILRYQKRVSGPVIDRIDIHLDVPAVKLDKLTEDDKGRLAESSLQIQKRVQKARDMQTKRFSARGGSSSGRKSEIASNSEMVSKDVKELLELSSECRELLRLAVSRMNLSARSYYRTIKLARTIADLEDAKNIAPNHVAEALQYRPRVDNI